jgi:hypothetical protein
VTADGIWSLEGGGGGILLLGYMCELHTECTLPLKLTMQVCTSTYCGKYKDDRKYKEDRKYKDDRKYKEDRKYKDDRKYKEGLSCVPLSFPFVATLYILFSDCPGGPLFCNHHGFPAGLLFLQRHPGIFNNTRHLSGHSLTHYYR